jgi:hypothetical protein
MLYSPQKISQKETFLNDFKNKFPLDTIEALQLKPLIF